MVYVYRFGTRFPLRFTSCFSYPPNQPFYDRCGYVRRFFHECRVVVAGGAVGVVTDGTQDRERHFVRITNLCDGSALHFTCDRAELFDDPLFSGTAADELVTARNRTGNDMRFSGYLGR